MPIVLGVVAAARRRDRRAHDRSRARRLPHPGRHPPAGRAGAGAAAGGPRRRRRAPEDRAASSGGHDDVRARSPDLVDADRAAPTCSSSRGTTSCSSRRRRTYLGVMAATARAAVRRSRRGRRGRARAGLRRGGGGHGRRRAARRPRLRRPAGGADACYAAASGATLVVVDARAQPARRRSAPATSSPTAPREGGQRGARPGPARPARHGRTGCMPRPGALAPAASRPAGRVAPARPASSWPCWQLVIALALLALARARRLGRLVVEPLPVVVRAAESVEGRARLYRSGNARGRAADALRAGPRDRLAPRAGAAAGRDARRPARGGGRRTPARAAPRSRSALLYGPPPGRRRGARAARGRPRQPGTRGARPSDPDPHRRHSHGVPRAAGPRRAPREALVSLRAEVAKAVIGQDAAVTGLVIALLCRGPRAARGRAGRREDAARALAGRGAATST